MKVTRNVPLKVQVADGLRELIRNEYPNGEQIPTEYELADMLGVSRGTVSQALAMLTSEGLVLRKQGSGTFTNPNILRLSVRADRPFQIHGLIESAGYSPSVDLIEHEVGSADEETAALLDIPVHSDVLVVRRVFLADDEPAVFLVDRLPNDIITVPYVTEDLEKLLFHVLPDRCGVHLSYTLSNLIPSLATELVADLLKINPGTPLLQCNDTHYDTENRPIVYSTIYYSHNKLRFSVIRKVQP